MKEKQEKVETRKTAGNEDSGYLALYRPIDNFDLGWGLKVTDAGYTNIGPGDDYPAQHHPAPYMFTWKTGRKLSNFQIVFIGWGEGVIETEHGGTAELKGGDVFVLFPGEWHRYRPKKAVGWTERWCGFSGAYAEQVMGAFFSVKSPVVRGADATAVKRRLRCIGRLFKDGRTSCVPSLVAETVGLLTDIAPFAAQRKLSFASSIGDACDELAARFDENIDLEDLSRRHGMSYPLFRRLFKAQTGFSPHAYVLEMRLNRAKVLLRETSLSVEDIGTSVGFSSLAYFSAAFQKRLGVAPSSMRVSKT
ncbi:MAG: AraC family transcriptional regulator [Kiritimatiellae bacterium]|nr:AraC family transcriptional regulator [Kiritimatiellia bacterium]